MSVYERLDIAASRRANSIADADRRYNQWQTVLGAAGVAFTGIAAFWAWRATHWAKDAATHAKSSADADNAALNHAIEAAIDAKAQLEAVKTAERCYISVGLNAVQDQSGAMNIVARNGGRTRGQVLFSRYAVLKNLPRKPTLEGVRFAKWDADVDLFPNGSADVVCRVSAPIPKDAKHIVGYMHCFDVYGSAWRQHFRFDAQGNGHWEAHRDAKWAPRIAVSPDVRS